MEVLGLLGVAVSVGLVVWIVLAHARGPRMRRRFEWTTVPRLRVADGVDAVTRRSCQSAWSWLEAIGCPVGDVLIGGAPVAVPGEIVIVSIDEWAFPDHAGRSTTNVEARSRSVNHSTIELPFAVSEDIALHELLHALGFVQHLDLRGHVFSSSTDRVGKDRRGIVAGLRAPIQR